MKSLSEVSSMNAPSPSTRNANEDQAQRSAEVLARGEDPMMQPSAAVAEPSRIEGGKPIAPRERAVFESRYGRDFSNVRVHTDQAAADATEEMGARAFTYGSNIAFNSGEFAPNTSRGQQLLAHELAHTMQPSEGGEPTVQMQPKKGSGGIGSEPPSESFVTMPNFTGAEKGFALFAHNRAELSEDGEAKILEALGQPTQAVTVHIHGYASSEGDADYNMNLSAHRAIAVKHFIESHLPADSKVIVYAHGETKDFGAQTKNRRVGVDVMEGVFISGYKPKISRGHDYQFGKQGLDQPGPFKPNTGIDWKPPIPDPPPPVILWNIPPLTPRYDLMDVPKVLGPFAGHGKQPSDLGNVHEEWGSLFWKYRRVWGLSDEWAARFANWELSGTVKSTLERDAPNAIDKSNQDWKAAHPDEKSTPTIWSPNLLELFGPKKKKESK